MHTLKDAFLEILSRYQGILHKVNLVYFANRTEREDNLQEIIYNLWKAFPQLKNRDKPASWIYAVSINTSISRIRRKSLIEYRDTLPESSGGDDPVQQMEKEEQQSDLLREIRRLNEIDRTIMLLYLEERSYEEIASITGLSRNHIGVRINRAKEQLKKNLNSNYNGN